jgi:EmrB/QacA subfamily drug resistance transporter
MDDGGPTPPTPAGTSAPAPTAAVSALLDRADLRKVLFGLMLGLFLSALEQSVVTTALPTMAGDLGGASQISWVVSAYLLTSTVVTPLYGKLSDLVGRRIAYLSSILVFLAGSLLCGVAQSMPQLVAARAVQGLGGGGLLSLAFVVVGAVLSPRDRGRYIGIFTGTFAFASVSGPLFGGFLVDNVGWRWIFLANVPLGVPALVLTGTALRKLPFRRQRRSVDWLGATLLVGSSVCLMLVAIQEERRPYGLAVVGVVLGIAFVVQERRAAEPLLPMRLFTNRSVAAAYGMNFSIMFGLIAVTTFLPLFLQVSTGASATRSGLQVVPQSLAITTAATLSGAFISRIGRYKWALLIGPVIATTGMISLSTIGADTTVSGLAPFLVVLGLGLGLTFPNTTLAVQNAIDPADLGSGTSTLNFFRNLGSTFGAAVSGAVLSARLDTELARRLSGGTLDSLGGADGLVRSPTDVRELPPELRSAVVEATAASVTHVFRLAVPILGAGFVLALLIRELPLRRTAGLEHVDAPAH